MDIELGIEPELLGLEYLTSDHIREHFMEAIQILQEAVMMKQTDATDYKQRQFTNLKDKILVNCTNNQIQAPIKSRYPR